MSESWPCVGEFPMKVVEWKHEVLRNKQTGKESDYVFLLCRVTEGDFAGEETGMKVFLLKKDGTPNEIARQTLLIAGWTGKDFANMPGLGVNVFPGIMTKRTWNNNDYVELTGIKGVSAGVFRGEVADKNRVRNLAKMFESKTEAQDDDCPI